ncbi:hypothetical protein G6F43_006631 [Rhizopus delemar]|nr:hypothetical protein G6F43_006631 [Rhizopus delemar]
MGIPEKHDPNYSASTLEKGDDLPTLDDVLYRKSQPPVCLYNYYIVLRDRLELDILLDFWLDVAQAMALHKRYVKYLAKQTPRSSNQQSKRPLPSPIDQSRSSISSSPEVITHMLLNQPRPSMATTVNSTKRPPPTQVEMAEAVERIYLRYIMPNAEKEIIQLPKGIRQAISDHFSHHNESEGPDDPSIYKEAQHYVHQLLETTLPSFIKYKVFMNLTFPQQVGRLGLGFFLLLIGFSLEFSLIFLDVHPWQTRLWGTLPVGFGVFFIVTSIIGIDPIW